MSEEEKKEGYTCYEPPQEQLESLKRIAKERGITVKELISKYIDDFIREEERKEKTSNRGGRHTPKGGWYTD